MLPTHPSHDTDVERGAILVEYSALLVLVLLAGFAALTVFGVSVADLFADSYARFAGAIEAAA